ncbi:MAG TPA: patatin-like phospholipase family protein [Solirubrobacteraceae bacterium]|nr:patatin-like phospholipase family protein [Solirubrobacteraceae bacterium]
MTTETAADEKRVDLVFEGGGVKGIGLAGAFSYLDEQGFKPQRVAGTSAGAITAALVASGYSGEELRSLVMDEMKFKSFEDGGRWPVSQALELAAHKGLHPGKYFESWMRERLEEKGITKFGQLRVASADGDAAAQYRLQVIASDITEQRMLVLPRDAQEHLGLDPDELEIAAAVRMSMSIPIFFDPVVYHDPRKPHDQRLIVDGGLLSNFPVWLFDTPDGQVPRWPTFGLLLVAPNQQAPLVPGDEPARTDEGKVSILGFLLAIGHTMMEAHDRLYVEQANYARTIPINTLGVQTTQFSIDDDPELKRKLYESGRNAAAEFLKTWDFDAYIKTFRQGDQPTRRERVAAAMKAHAG